MVSCEYCNTILSAMVPFCPRCGSRTRYFMVPSSAMIHEYQGIQYRDKGGKRIQFMPDGIRIFFLHGIGHCYDILIPYRNIHAVCYKKAGIETGFLSIVTARSGVQFDRAKKPIVSIGISKLLEDESTLLFNSNRKIREIYSILCRIYSTPSTTQPASTSGCTNASISPRVTIGQNFLPRIDLLEGHTFEYFCADLLAGTGFTDVRVTPGSGDQGVDVLAEKDGIRYAIQCKNYVSRLSNTPVQEVIAGRDFYKCHVGAVLTNSTFTDSAKELAHEIGILLWDRDYLQQLLNAMPDAESLVEKYVPQSTLAYIDDFYAEDDPDTEDDGDSTEVPDDDAIMPVPSRGYLRQRNCPSPWMIVLLLVCEILLLGFGGETEQRVKNIPLLLTGTVVDCLTIVLSIVMAKRREKRASSIAWAVIGCYISANLLFLFALALLL